MLCPRNKIKFYSSCPQGVCIAESAKFGAQCSDKLYLNRVGNHLEKACKGRESPGYLFQYAPLLFVAGAHLDSLPFFPLEPYRRVSCS